MVLPFVLERFMLNLGKGDATKQEVARRKAFSVNRGKAFSE